VIKNDNFLFIILNITFSKLTNLYTWPFAAVNTSAYPNVRSYTERLMNDRIILGLLI